MTWFVYVLLNRSATTYTGIAKDPLARLAKHNAGTGAKFTKGRGPWQMIHLEGPMGHGDALRRELAIKADADFKAALKAPAAFHPTAATLPAAAGAYVLLIQLQHAAAIHLPKQRDVTLPPGRYLYCGSAKGPGGIKSRVGRHMRKDKSVRWHVDQLTIQGDVAGAWVIPGGNECALAARLNHLPIPIPGFGSSDCRICASHLLSWPDGETLPLE